MDTESTMGTEDTASEVTSYQDDAPEVVDTEGQVETPDDSEEGAEVDQDQSEYKPNYGFKYFGKSSEIPEWARGFISDKDTEDKFRSLYAKSHGFDVLRERTTAREQEYSSAQTASQELQASLQERDDTLDELRHLRDTDLASFFEFSNIPVEKVIDFVEDHLKFLAKPEAEQNQISELRQRAVRARELERENNQFRSQSESQAADQHISTFNELIEHPDVEGFASKYDSVAGTAGAFRAAVIEYGESHEKRTGETIAPLEAIRHVYRKYKPFLQARDVEDSPQEDSPRQAATGRRPVVPTIGGTTSRAPSKRIFTSVEELKAHHKAMVANEG